MEAKILPECVGFIMDGNRRWAKAQDKPTLEGHQKGEEVFRESIDWVQEMGVPHAVYYAFSTENWNRSDDEVGYLMQLFEVMLQTLADDIKSKSVQIKVLGRLRDFSPRLQSLIKDVTQTNAGAKTTIWICLSYGGRAEIIDAVNTALSRGENVTESSFSNLLWSAAMPDPDLIIRTGGEQRLSNFLPWQSVYSELFFTNTFWPAFTKAEFLRIVDEYGKRQRRHGA